jgi:hypothetical protein
MKPIVIASLLLGGLALGCASSPAAPGEPAGSAETAPTEEAPAAEPVKPPAPLKTGKGLELVKARESVAALAVGMLRREVEKALGEPDRVETTSEPAPPAWTPRGGVLCIYEWKPEEGPTIQLLLGFDGDSQGARLSHLYWRRSS